MLFSSDSINLDKFILGTLDPDANSTIGFLGSSFFFCAAGGPILLANIFLIAAKPPPPHPIFIGGFELEEFEVIVGFFGAVVVVGGFVTGFGAGFGAGLGTGFGVGFGGGFVFTVFVGFNAAGLGGAVFT
jgi:hypothetical protein